MQMNPGLYRLLVHVKHWRDRDLFETIRRMEANQWLSGDELASLAWEKQRRLVSHAYGNCRFYREKYDAAGFHPNDLKSPADFLSIPIITKEEVRANIEGIVASGTEAGRLQKKFTGGSTGKPVMVYHDRFNSPLMFALHLRTIQAWGLNFGCKTAHIWGLNPLNQEYLYSSQTWLRRFLKNYVLLDAFDMSEEKMVQFARILQQMKPDLIISYTSAMSSFAQFVRDHHLSGISPRAIWLTSEPIHDFQKKLIEEVFHSKVYDQYGSVEMFFYASECGERDGLHINSDVRTVEVVDDNGIPVAPGDLGQVIVTDLENYAAPLIRYRNEDVATLSDRPCTCGRGLPMMGKVTGRIYDMFVLPDGSQIYGHRFTTFFYDHVQEISKFQVHQTHKDRVIVRVVPTEKCQADELSGKIMKSFSDFTKGQVRFEIKFVEDISREASGKYRFAKSDVILKHDQV